MIIVIIGIVVAVLVYYFVVRKRKINLNETIIAFTGGLGSNKSVLSVKTFITQCLRAKRKYRWRCWYLPKKIKVYNMFHKKKKQYVKSEKPLFLSNIPIWHKKLKVRHLTPDVLLLKCKLTPLSVVLIDEADTFCNQFEFSIPNIKANFDEFMRFYRHYTFGGKIILNTQCSANLVLQIRRRANVVYNLSMNKKLFGFFRTNCRVITISDEIVAVETSDKDADTMFIYGCYWGLKKVFDTHCYSGRVKPLSVFESLEFQEDKLKTNVLLRCPTTKYDYLNYLDTTD